jgi:hypothetical protein
MKAKILGWLELVTGTRAEEFCIIWVDNLVAFTEQGFNSDWFISRGLHKKQAIATCEPSQHLLDGEVKGKILFVLNHIFGHQDMKAYGEEKYSSIVLDLDTRGR